jgi:hypothetical protein
MANGSPVSYRVKLESLCSKGPIFFQPRSMKVPYQLFLRTSQERIPHTGTFLLTRRHIGASPTAPFSFAQIDRLDQKRTTAQIDMLVGPCCSVLALFHMTFMIVARRLLILQTLISFGPWELASFRQSGFQH